MAECEHFGIAEDEDVYIQVRVSAIGACVAKRSSCLSLT